jgi:hypothetical protein
MLGRGVGLKIDQITFMVFAAGKTKTQSLRQHALSILKDRHAEEERETKTPGMLC